MDTGINVMQVPQPAQAQKFDRIATPKPPPDSIYNAVETKKSGVYEFPIMVLKQALMQFQAPLYKDMLVQDIDYLCVKLGLKATARNQDSFNSREMALRQEQIKIGRTLNSAELTERYNYIVDLYENTENNVAALQMSIELMTNNS